MRGLGVRAALLLLLGTGAVAGAAACTNRTCASCATAAECASVPGCFDQSLEEYAPKLCSQDVTVSGRHADFGTEKADTEEAEVVIVEDLAELGCYGSIVLGTIGGIFAFILPCCVLRRRAQRTQSRWMLSASDEVVRRTQASVKRKWVAGGNERSASCMVKVEFQASRSDGATVVVVAETPVLESSFRKANQGKGLEVAYTVDKEHRFEIVPDLEVWSESRYGNVVLVAAAIGFFGVVGLAIGVASGPMTGCYDGYVPFWVLLMAGSICGHFFCWPLSQKFKRVWFPVRVKPCLALSPIQETANPAVSV